MRLSDIPMVIGIGIVVALAVVLVGVAVQAVSGGSGPAPYLAGVSGAVAGVVSALTLRRLRASRS